MGIAPQFPPSFANRPALCVRVASLLMKGGFQGHRYSSVQARFCICDFGSLYHMMSANWGFRRLKIRDDRTKITPVRIQK